MTEIRLAGDLLLPIEAVTETFAILAKRRVGKSNAAVVMAEQFYDAGLPWVAVDPKGDWWGVRSSSDGRGPGLAIPVFGGDHGDIPLEPGAGAYLADFIADQRLTCVLDVSGFSKADETRFLLPFAERLLKVNRDPLHLFLEECDDYIPQEKAADELKLVRAFSRLVRHGGFRGIGCTLISQRPALVNKNVLSQTETLILMRTLAPLDQDAAKGWLKHHPEAAAIVTSLSSLRPGEAWVVSPAFLERTVRITFNRRRTFDSGATPMVGEARRDPARLADVDLTALREAMAETIERVMAEDPKALRARIAELERALAAAKTAQPEPERVEVPVLTEENVASLREAGADLTAVRDRLDLAAREMHEQITAAMERLAPTVEAIATAGRTPAPVPATPPPAPRPAPVSKPQPRQPAPVGGEGDPSLPKAQRAILAALAQHGQRTAKQIGLLTGYSHRSGGFNGALAALRAAGLIEGASAGIAITPAGIDALGDYDPLPTGRALIDWWKAHHLGKAEAAILDVLVDRHPDGATKQEIAVVTGYSANSGGFNGALARLRSMEIVSGKPDLTVNPTLIGEDVHA